MLRGLVMLKNANILSWGILYREFDEIWWKTRKFHLLPALRPCAILYYRHIVQALFSR